MVVKPQTSARSRPGDLKSINDNHCFSNVVGLVNSVNVSDKMEGLNPPPPVTSKSETVFPHVNSFVASVPFASGSPQKKGVNPVYCQSIREINHEKDVSCVDHLIFVKIVTNVPTVVTNLPVGARLQQFWEKWETLGASPKIIRILREGYTHPKDAYFHIPIHSQSRKYMRFHIQGQSYQFKALPFGLSTAPMEFTVVAKEVKLMALRQGIRIHQYLDDWLVRASTLHTCLQHTQTLVTLCQELGWLVNKEKSELAPKQVFNFVGYQFNLKEGKVRPTEERWQALTDKIRSMMSDPVCPVRKFMSLIGLLTATEKQVHLGRLYMRPIQWHLKNNWRVPESLEKVIPVHNLHINHLELKAVFLALKEFRTLVCNKTVLIATDNTTVVAYINKEGGMKSGSLCALLWRILSWCTRQQVTLRARHIPGRLNVIADKLSRLGQTIQTEWSLHPAVFQAVCTRWHQPKVDLFATRFNNKLPQFVSPVPDPQAWAVDALSLSWEDLDPYAFPPAAILGKVVEKLQDYPCNRIILIDPGWPNMPWFWDLVAMSSQIPLCLPSIPNLVSQPFNQVLHRNLSNLNLHAWLLEPQQSRSKASLRQWQHELRLLKEDQPDLSMRQSGPFLQSGASVIRWTSGHHL